MQPVVFFVPGRPVTQGSKVPIGYQQKGTGKIRGTLVEDRSRREILKTWRGLVASRAVEAMEYGRLRFPAEVPVELWLDFILKRPRTIPKTRTCPTVRPDDDKLERAVRDALTGVMYHDDAQIVEVHKRKRYFRPTDISEGVIVLARAVTDANIPVFDWCPLEQHCRRGESA